ncbi:hypothetical protein CEXT_412071 [Caerostris extrusa]|uniref:Uncharacterized protein n=1 Tax=Caerostris extrusa TaxID=172846 RepID=A0AAV4R5G7_CAEEX|nr:hypothetical protein CEXT_412071 [Caerostris extrusa]
MNISDLEVSFRRTGHIHLLKKQKQNRLQEKSLLQERRVQGFMSVQRSKPRRPIHHSRARCISFILEQKGKKSPPENPQAAADESAFSTYFISPTTSRCGDTERDFFPPALPLPIDWLIVVVHSLGNALT